MSFHFDVYNEYGQPLGSASGVGYLSALAALLDERVESFEAQGTVEPGSNVRKYTFRGAIVYYVSRRLGQFTPASLDDARRIARGEEPRVK